MEISFWKNGQEIKDLETWKELGHPKSDKQWKPGRSSMCMAELALSPHFEKIIAKVLTTCGIKEQDFECEPEAKTGLGKGFGQGGQRNHDLLMKGKDCVIGIEAKVSESFDEDFKNALQDQKQNNPNKKTRAESLKEYLAPEADVDNIGYQLFTATRGTIAAAQKAQKGKCILLVIVFVGNIDKGKSIGQYNKDYEKNNDVFNRFLLGTGAAQQNGKIIKDGVECWIKKAEVNISFSISNLK